MIKTIFSATLWLMYGISFLCSFIGALIVFLFTFPFDKHRRYPNAVMMFFGQSIMWLNPFWKIRHFGLDNFEKGPKGKVAVANHQSFLDMPLLATLPVNMKWVSKKELFRIPFVGWTMSLSKHISVDRGSKNAAKSLLASIEPIKDGVSVMIFPEGTRSREGKLKTFKKGAFYLSKENDFYIQPIVVEGTYKLMPPENWRMNYRGELYISVLPPVNPAHFETVDDLTNHVWSLIDTEVTRLQSLKSELIS
jgi:1-acyl-sn-glycerol-3-phosphate acyltransferase